VLVGASLKGGSGSSQPLLPHGPLDRRPGGGRQPALLRTLPRVLVKLLDKSCYYAILKALTKVTAVRMAVMSSWLTKVKTRALKTSLPPHVSERFKGKRGARKSKPVILRWKVCKDYPLKGSYSKRNRAFHLKVKNKEESGNGYTKCTRVWLGRGTARRLGTAR